VPLNTLSSPYPSPISAITSLTLPSTLSNLAYCPYPCPAMSSPSPPPPYSLQPPPYTRRQRKLPREPSPPRPPRLSSRELLTDALKCAQRAVKLDMAKSDLPLAVAAYDEAIAILQCVIARRSQKPGITGEVERVTSIVSQLPSPPLHPLSRPPPSPLFVSRNHQRSQSRTIVLAVSFFFLSFLFCSCL
jgi:hypothetical protein